MKSFTLLFLFILNVCIAQSDVPLTLYKQFNGNYGYTIIGNTHNALDNTTTPTAQCSLLSNSSATINLLPNENIVSAHLYWGGIGDGTLNQTIKLNGTNYAATETYIGYPENNQVISYFSSVVDVTNQLISTGNGIYTFSNLNLNSLLNNYCSSGNYIAGWHILIIYNNMSLQNSQLNIYYGANICSGLFNNGATPLTINNLNVIASQNSKMTYVAYNGSRTLFLNESVSMNNNVLSNTLNPPNNPFNSTNSFTGSTTNWNQDIDTFDISSFINVGDTQANIVFKSFYYRFVQTLVTSIRSELPDATVALSQVSGQEVCNNRNLLVNCTVKNTNSNAVLPVNVPVSFYADNVFLSTVFTPTPIAIGGVLPLQTTVTVPLSVSNTFNLRVVVDNAVGVSSTIAESNEANNESVQAITFSTTLITPVFALSNVICANSPAPVLPNTSTNGIFGTWAPAVVSNQNSGTYVFTPNPGQCAVPFSLITTITVLPIITPTFLGLPNSFCRGANVSVLPIVSSNGLLGTWFPAVISNQNSGDYVFTPSANQCGLPFTLSVTINPVVTPSFSLQNVFCINQNMPVLPLVSDNNIGGTWSPNVINNQNSGSYLFTPATAGTPSGLCASSSTLNVTINPIITPSFNLPISICQNNVAPILPATSVNNVLGAWLPAVASNQTSGSYIFTPAINQANAASNCALPFAYNLTVEPQIPITSEQFICSSIAFTVNNSVILNSGLSPNDFQFVWSFNNQQLLLNTPLISAVTAGDYQLVATPSGVGCPKIFQFTVKAFLPISATYLVSDDFSQNQTITVTASGGSGQYEYSFNNQTFQNYPIFSVVNGGDIEVVVRDNTDCAEVNKTITMWQYPRFFTPNGDSYNDTWTINTTKKISINIFDRFGRLLKQLKTGESWNGTFDSQPLPADDYWFDLSYNTEKVFKGHFSLKR